MTSEKAGQILKEVIREVARQEPKGVLLIASNPVDVLTHAAWWWSGLPVNRVIGSGTSLDTSRFRRRIAEHYGVASDNVHAYIIGEHGESQVPVTSSARIAGMSLEDFCRELGLPHDEDMLRKIANDTRATVWKSSAQKERRTTALERRWLVLQAPFCGMNMQF